MGGLPCAFAYAHRVIAHPAESNAPRTPAFSTLLAVAFTRWAISIRDSFASGRLRFEPRVDDVLYFARGHELALAFADSGIGGVLRNWRAHPPHSPLLAMLTALSDSCFGNDLFFLYSPTAMLALLFIGSVAAFASRVRL